MHKAQSDYVIKRLLFAFKKYGPFTKVQIKAGMYRFNVCFSISHSWHNSYCTYKRTIITSGPYMETASFLLLSISGPSSGEAYIW